MPDCPFERLFLTRAKPDRRIGFLDRLGFHRNIFKIPECTPRRGFGLGPQGFHNFDALNKPSRTEFARIAKNRFWNMATNTDTNGEPALTHIVQTRQAFGELNGIAENRQQNRGAEPSFERDRGKIGQQTDRFENGEIADNGLLYP